MTAQPRASCDCVQRINEQLVAKNTELPVGINFTTGNVDLAIPLRKLDSRKRLGSSFIVATYCPFCGLKLRSDS